MSEAQSCDAMTSLVKFMIWLAILGTILAVILYFGLALPAQQSLLHVPANAF